MKELILKTNDNEVIMKNQFYDDFNNIINEFVSAKIIELNYDYDKSAALYDALKNLNKAIYNLKRWNLI